MGLLRRDTDFRGLWLGQSLSVAGTQVSAVALPLVAALTLHAGPGGVGAIATAAYLPNVVLPLFAGEWLQRRRRRPAMIAADVVRAVSLSAVPIAFAFDALSEPLLIIVALVVGSAGVLFDIGSFTHIPSLVAPADLAAANRAMQGSATAAQVGGPGMAGLLVQLAGPAVAVAVDAVSYLASVMGIMRIRRPEPPPIDDSAGAGIFDGLRQIVRNRYLRALSLHAALYNAAAQLITVNLVVWVVHDRGLSAGQYGLALSAAGAGAFLGTLLALRGSALLGFGRAFAASLVLSTGAPLLLSALPWRGAALAASLATVEFVSGMGLGSANVLSVTLRQIVVPTGSLARSNGGYRLLIFGAIPFGSALAGLIGAHAGARAGVLVGTVALAASGIPMYLRRIRTLSTAEAASASASGGIPDGPTVLCRRER